MQTSCCVAYIRFRPLLDRTQVQCKCALSPAEYTRTLNQDFHSAESNAGSIGRGSTDIQKVKLPQFRRDTASFEETSRIKLKLLRYLSISQIHKAPGFQ